MGKNAELSPFLAEKHHFFGSALKNRLQGLTSIWFLVFPVCAFSVSRAFLFRIQADSVVFA
jgi:hypothetical protein